MVKYYYVKFHVDGGETCSFGLRRFSDENKANEFAELLRNEKGHTCGSESVRQFSIDVWLPNIGYITHNGVHPSLDKEFCIKLLALAKDNPNDQM